MKALALVLVLVSGVAAADTYPLSEVHVTPRVDVGAALASAQDWPCGIEGTVLPASWLRGRGEMLWMMPLAAPILEHVEGRERIVVTERGAELQRLLGDDVGHIPLHVVGHVTAGIDIYAFVASESDDPPGSADVLLFASFPAGEVSYGVETKTGGEATIQGFMPGTDCGMLQTELRVADGNSPGGEVNGTLLDGRSFLVSAGVSRTSRDREPILSVTVRKVDKR
jgi:hypothetical protein